MSTTFEVRHQHGFVVVPNALARDGQLRRASRGLLVELLSHSDGFVVTEATLVRAGQEGRDAVRAMVRELETAGYLERQEIRTEGSRFAGVRYIVRATAHTPKSADSPSPENPSTAFPSTGEPSTENPTLKKTNSKKTKEEENQEGKEDQPPPSVEDAKTPKPPAVRSSKRGTRLPAGWMPSPELIEAMTLEVPYVDQRREHAKFTDYWNSVPGQKGVKLDWDATWRNWLRKAAESAPRTGNRSTDRLISGMQAMGVNVPVPNQPTDAREITGG
jgi:hypothetical protein